MRNPVVILFCMMMTASVLWPSEGAINGDGLHLTILWLVTALVAVIVLIDTPLLVAQPYFPPARLNNNSAAVTAYNRGAKLMDEGKPQLAAQSIKTAINVSDRLWITADRHMLLRAVLNLVLNAVDAMPNGGRLEISAANGPGGVEISVSDTGCGMSDDNRQKAFEPFFTTKQGGTGLGLAIVLRIAEVHRGSVRADGRDCGGSTFTLFFPRLVNEAAA